MEPVETDLRSEFISKGINQTLHRVYLQIDCPVQILSSYRTMEEKISNQFQSTNYFLNAPTQ